MTYSIRFEDASKVYEYVRPYERQVMIIEHPDHSAKYLDAGEPEDNTFYRDWYWIQEELMKAYELGLDDGYDKAISDAEQKAVLCNV